MATCPLLAIVPNSYPLSSNEYRWKLAFEENTPQHIQQKYLDRLEVHPDVSLGIDLLFDVIVFNYPINKPLHELATYLQAAHAHTIKLCMKTDDEQNRAAGVITWESLTPDTCETIAFLRAAVKKMQAVDSVIEVATGISNKIWFSFGPPCATILTAVELIEPIEQATGAYLWHTCINAVGNDVFVDTAHTQGANFVGVYLL